SETFLFRGKQEHIRQLQDSVQVVHFSQQPDFSDKFRVFFKELIYFLHFRTFSNDDEFGFNARMYIFKNLQYFHNPFYRAKVRNMNEDFLLVLCKLLSLAGLYASTKI